MMEQKDRDIRHHYIEKGNGTPLILLHGNGEESSYFEHQISYFSKEYRVIALDTRGHGKTLRGTAPFTIRQFAEDLCLFLDDMGIGKAHILGFSDGANIAMIFAMKYPERVDKLILNGGNLEPHGMKWSVWAPIQASYSLCSFLLRVGAGKGAKAAEDGSIFKLQKNAELLGLMINDPNIAPEELAQIKARTLVLAGTKDMIKDAHTRLIAKHIPQAKLEILEGNHFIANQKPGAYNQIVENFLKGAE